MILTLPRNTVRRAEERQNGRIPFPACVHERMRASASVHVCANAWQAHYVRGLGRTGWHAPTWSTFDWRKTDGTTFSSVVSTPFLVLTGEILSGHTMGALSSTFGSPWDVHRAFSFLTNAASSPDLSSMLSCANRASSRDASSAFGCKNTQGECQSFELPTEHAQRHAEATYHMGGTKDGGSLKFTQGGSLCQSARQLCRQLRR